MVMPPLFPYQQKAIELWLENPGMLNLSDPGTGKTRTTLEGIVQRGSTGKVLVLAPLSILQPAWGNDIMKWTPHLRYSIAYAENRAKAFANKYAQVFITNHDAVKWLAERPEVLEGFDTLVIDEFTAFKNPTSQRTKALLALADKFEFKYLLSGTPTPKSVLDLWAPARIVDGGERLGKLFHKFRADVCYALPVRGAPAGAVAWIDRSDAMDRVMMALDDVVYRVPLSGLPENREYTMEVEMPRAVMTQYRELQKESILALSEGNITAAHAGARLRKMLQLLTGAVYDSAGNAKLIHTARYELVMQLVDERPQSLVAFNWRHERENLVTLAKKMGISYGVIDGETPVKEREAIVEQFQNGELRVIFAHPQSAGHGLTLTAGHATIWASPTYNAEHYQQFNRRIYRTGQTKRTETIRIAAKDTCEIDVYENLDGKMVRLEQLLELALTVSNAA